MAEIRDLSLHVRGDSVQNFFLKRQVTNFLVDKSANKIVRYIWDLTRHYY
jgi:hypothetical protein